MDFDWDDYFELTHDSPPRDVVVRAAALAGSGAALDLGCGGGRDTRAVANLGFSVTAVDREPGAGEYVSAVANVTFVCSDLADFKFASYDLVFSVYVLPFLARVSFETVISRAVSSLRPGGVIAMVVFGPRDGWAGVEDLTFVSLDELRTMLGDLEVVSATENEEDGQTADGEAKHWHLIEVIARRGDASSLPQSSSFSAATNAS